MLNQHIFNQFCVNKLEIRKRIIECVRLKTKLNFKDILLVLAHYNKTLQPGLDKQGNVLIWHVITILSLPFLFCM